MGAEEWRYAESFDEITICKQTYFLDSSGKANDTFFSEGFLRLSPGTGPPDLYRYDPRDKHSAELDAEAQANGNSITDQSLVLALRGKSLIYHSPPFEEDTEVSGCFELSVWISIDCSDTDLYASIYEVCHDGQSIRLSTDGVRARYREGLRTPKRITTCASLRYNFDRFTFVSRRIKRGHRLRLVIAPMGRLIDATFAEKNYNGGGVVAEECIKDGRPVTVTLFHDEGRPSALSVPLGQARLPEPTAGPLQFESV
jgi:predicted acyl esterase